METRRERVELARRGRKRQLAPTSSLDRSARLGSAGRLASDELVHLLPGQDAARQEPETWPRLSLKVQFNWNARKEIAIGLGYIKQVRNWRPVNGIYIGLKCAPTSWLAGWSANWKYCSSSDDANTNDRLL